MEARQCMGAILTAAVLFLMESLVRPRRAPSHSSTSVGYAPTTLVISREHSPCVDTGGQSQFWHLNADAANLLSG